MTSGYYRTSSPVTALPMIVRWISDVPSKIVKLMEVGAVCAGRWRAGRTFVSTYSAPQMRAPTVAGISGDKRSCHRGCAEPSAGCAAGRQAGGLGYRCGRRSWRDRTSALVRRRRAAGLPDRGDSTPPPPSSTEPRRCHHGDEAARAAGDVGGRDRGAVPCLPAVRAVENSPGRLRHPPGTHQARSHQLCDCPVTLRVQRMEATEQATRSMTASAPARG
jgi:hypothetical protein